MDTQYRPARIEAETQARWEKERVFKAIQDHRKEKFYCLSMFPYPSGKLHIGHVRNYTIGDVISRYQRMQGKNVLQPMGWDAFGLPAENAAIEHGIAPANWTRRNIEVMRSQLKRLGFAYDWSRELATCDPSYYRWEQWFFTLLYRKGLVYRKSALVNWDPVDRTVLANEQVIDGCGWRSGAPVERREIPQWFLRITAYAEELLQDLERLEGWPEAVRVQQAHWIGRSEGVEIDFQAMETDETLAVYTTRPDTLMGTSYLVVAPEHSLAREAARKRPELQRFLEEATRGGVAESAVETMEKQGVPLPLTVRHPVTDERLPVWVGNFVLMSYGTGAVMGVPAHDQRDWEFARKYRLPVRQVVFPSDAQVDIEREAYTGSGVLNRSGRFDGLQSREACTAIADFLERENKGRRKVKYRLRDWCISRQRYWGCPIPILYDEDDRPHPVAEEDLPVELPEDVLPEGKGSPLTELETFRHAAGRNDRRRETDTFDTFFESSWYYARFCCPDRHDAMLDQRTRYWLPVDQYVGGIEHAVMHLLYARFFHKLMRDEGLVEGDEPFTRLLTQGMVLKDGRKMSKSHGNTVDPQSLIDRHGADTVRLYVMFAAPPEQSLEWSDQDVQGASRFLKRLWRLTADHVHQGGTAPLKPDDLDAQGRELRYQVHRAILKVSDDIGRRYTFNTAIAAVMETINAIARFSVDTENERSLVQEGLEASVLLLSPVVPHIADRLWREVGHEGSIVNAPWPQADPAALERDEIELVVQIDGKRRASIRMPPDASEEQIREAAISVPNVQRLVGDCGVSRFIVVPGRLINIVSGSAE